MTLRVPDGDRAARFYGALFGWTLHGGAGGLPHRVDHSAGRASRTASTTPTSRIFFRVDDIESVAQRVRDLGGEVLSVADYDSGGNAECVDDQGLRFDLFRPRAGY